MTDNHLAIWEAHADIEPKFTKVITGKAYKGTSPNPHYVIYCLTKLFGPVGQGFGWRVLAEDFTQLGGETLHWCRIEFWHTDRANTYEAYGQTKAAYTTKGGSVIVDEDAPKKSLTDAIVKASSQLGIAANIFLGRWDDSKYVAEVAEEFRQAERSKTPPVDMAHERAVTDAQAMIESADSLQDLQSVWKAMMGKTQADRRVIEAKDKRKAELSKQGEAA